MKMCQRVEDELIAKRIRFSDFYSRLHRKRSRHRSPEETMSGEGLEVRSDAGTAAGIVPCNGQNDQRIL